MMGKNWIEEWGRVKAKDIAALILKTLADPSYVPTTTSDLAVNILGMGGPLHWEYTTARDQLVELGFITYAWGEPVVLSNAFREFVEANPGNWFDVLEGTAAPAAEVPPPETPPQPPPVQYPALVEDGAFWARFHSQTEPMLKSIF